MTEQWRELKETITELRDNDGTATQQEVCKFLANYMGVLEKQMIDPIARVLEIIDYYEEQCTKAEGTWLEMVRGDVLALKGGEQG